MAKRINVSIPDELYKGIQKAKQGFSKDFSISKICQKAIRNELDNATGRATAWTYGFKEGKEYIQTLTPTEQIAAKKNCL